MLEWNVYIEDVNASKIVTHNIFDHYAFWDDIVQFKKKYKKNIKNGKSEQEARKEFEESVDRSLRYYYWSKCEWEILLTTWITSENKKFGSKKIDVYEQVKNNWYCFINYLYDNINNIKESNWNGM